MSTLLLIDFSKYFVSRSSNTLGFELSDYFKFILFINAIASSQCLALFHVTPSFDINIPTSILETSIKE